MRKRFTSAFGGGLRWLALAACVPLAACGRADDARPSEPAAPPAAAAPAKPAAAAPAAPATAAPAGTVASQVTDIDLATCLRQARGEKTASTCPGYLLGGLREAIDTCAGVGGRLEAAPQSDVWSLDVDADGQAEVMLDLTQNYFCDGAASVFSCGSLGCPVALYAKRDGGWVTLGAVSSFDAPKMEVMAPPAGTGYGTLRGGCAGERPCDQLTHYTWKGAYYDSSAIEARGHWVDVDPGGLWTLTEDTAVLAAPAKGAEVIDYYSAGTVVAVIGNARDADWRYVSPCNACASGFVETGVLRKDL